MKLFLKGLTFLMLVAFAPLANAQDTIWRNFGTDPSFENPNNWNNGIPSAGLDAYIVPNGIADVGGGFLVTKGGSVNITVVASASHTSDSLNITNDVAGDLQTGTVTLTFAAGKSYSVSSTRVDGGESLIYSGNMNVSNLVTVGNDGSGSFTLSSGTLNNSGGIGIFIGASGTGNNGTFVQNNSSTVIANVVTVGEGGPGIYTLNGTSQLQTTANSGSQITVGNNGGAGTLTINGGATVQINNDGGLIVGSGTGSSSGTVIQAGSTSTVNFAGNTVLVLGEATGTSGSYQLQGGTLNIGTTNVDTPLLDIGSSGTGVFNQSGGALVARESSLVLIGDAGTGLYQLSGGTADFQNGFLVGAGTGSGAVIQSGGTLTVENATVDIGSGASGSSGSYTMSGGTAAFGAGVIVGAAGSITQTGGTLAITGGTLDLSAVGSVYTLAGGTLQVTNTGLVGTTGEGRLNLGGGTLQVTTGGAFTEGLDGTLSGTSTVSALTATTVTMAGDLDGGGGINFVGGAGTVFSFSGVNSYTGSTGITSGILNATQANIENSSALNIGTAGTLNLTLAAGGLGFQGPVTGGGAFNATFANAGDALVLKNTSGFTGNLNLAGADGTLQVYNGNFASITGNGSDVTIGGPALIGVGTVPASGTVTIGNATYTGLTTVTQGFTLNANALGGGITNNGTTYASGAGGDVINNGTLGLSKNSATGTNFAINGDLTANAGSMILVRASGTGTPVADSFTASGTGTISSASIIKVTGSGNITTPIAILTADSGLSITPGALPILKTGLLFQATLTYDAGNNSIDLTAVQNPLADFALTPNEAATAVPIDLAVANSANLTPGQQKALNHILMPLNNLPSAQQLARALEQLSPESLQYARNIAFENTTFLVQKMNSVDADLRSGYGGLDTNQISVVSPIFNSGLGRSMQGLMASNDAFHQPAPNGVNYYPGGDSTPAAAGETISSSSPEATSARASASHSEPVPDPSTQVISDSPNPYLSHADRSNLEAPAFSEFISGDAVLADLNQNQSNSNAPSSSASYTAAAATAGVAFRMNSHLAAGVLIDYTHTDARTDDSGSKTKVDSYSPGLFATYFDHGFYVNGLASFGYNNYENTRKISTLGTGATSSPTGQQYVGSLDVGYDFHPDKNWVVGPTLGLTYTHLDIDSFRETGSDGADLAIDSQSADSLRSRLGGHVIFQTNTGDVLLQPTFSATWQHEFLADSDGITSRFTDFSSTPFTINTAGPTRDSALIGLGLNATLSNSLAFYMNYFADVGFNDYFAQSVIGGFKTRF